VFEFDGIFGEFLQVCAVSALKSLKTWTYRRVLPSSGSTPSLALRFAAHGRGEPGDLHTLFLVMSRWEGKLFVQLLQLTRKIG